MDDFIITEEMEEKACDPTPVPINDIVREMEINKFKEQLKENLFNEYLSFTNKTIEELYDKQPLQIKFM